MGSFKVRLTTLTGVSTGEVRRVATWLGKPTELAITNKRLPNQQWPDAEFPSEAIARTEAQHLLNRMRARCADMPEYEITVMS